MAVISASRAFGLEGGSTKKKNTTGSTDPRTPIGVTTVGEKPQTNKSETQQPTTPAQPTAQRVRSAAVETKPQPLYPGTPGPGGARKEPEAERDKALGDDYDRARAALQDAQGKLDEAGQPRAQTEAERNTLADYERAMAALRQTEKDAPGYDGGLDAQIGELYGKITGRGDFQYNLNEDALWQQLKDDYTRAGKNAMRDTMGQAAMLTGGYGSSYSQAAGQAAYDEYLTQLSQRAPELYDRAYARYKDEGDEMRKNLDFLLERDRTGYDRYRDAYGDWLKERDYLGGQAEDAYNRAMQERGYADERADLAYNRALQELGLAGDNEREAYDRRVRERAYADEREETAYNRQNDRRDLLLSLAQLGYTPGEQEIRDAGLTQAQVDALREAYAPKTQTAGAASTAKAGATASARSARLSKSRNGEGLPTQQMASIYSAISKADSPDNALALYDEITDQTLNRMSKTQKNQLVKALELAGAAL